MKLLSYSHTLVYGSVVSEKWSDAVPEMWSCATCDHRRQSDQRSVTRKEMDKLLGRGSVALLCEKEARATTHVFYICMNTCLKRLLFVTLQTKEITQK